MVFHEKKITVAEEIDAKKVIYNGAKALTVIAEAEKLYVASGKKVLEFDINTDEAAEIEKKICGRTGNLRAPTLKIGKTFYVGFNEQMYDSL